MSISVKRLIVKTLKITGISLVSMLVLMFLLPVLFPKTITEKVERVANQNINGKLSFSKTGLSFFKHFPKLTLTLSDFVLLGSAPFEQDTLIASREISLAIDLSSLLHSRVQISKIYLSQANINILVDSAGHANYNVYKASPPKSKTQADTAAASLGIDQIIIEKSRLAYNDASIPMQINARDFNYTGSGDLSKDVFDLHTHMAIDGLDFIYGGRPYVINKKVNADLVTSINTKSLEFIFQRNDLKINHLLLKFTGRFGFVKDGYNMDFKFDSYPANLNDIFSALPAEYAKYVETTEVNGTGVLHLGLSGMYISSKNISPDLDFSMQVSNGYVSNNKTPSPVKDLYITLKVEVPQLNPDSLKVDLDSLHFNIDKDRFDACFRMKGMTSPYIFARVNTSIDLAKWNRAFGVKAVDLQGQYELHLLAEGKYSKGVEKVGLRRYDTVITSIPKFSLQSSVSNGYIKYAGMPESIKNVGFKLDAQCPDSNIKHLTIKLTDLNANAINNFVKGNCYISNTKGLAIDGAIQARIHLEDLKKLYRADSIDLRGDLSADIIAKGRYVPVKKIFPVLKTAIELTDGYIQTKYYPHPIENVQISAQVVNTTGSLAGMKVFVKPISFTFEKQPFVLKAGLQNFADLHYDIQSHGTLDLGKIYRVFALKGYDVKGLITTNFSLKGKQSDATAGRYDKLFNSGTIKVKDLVLHSDLYPQPFIIKKGDFSFNQDKMQFDHFVASYAHSVFVLDGALDNVIDYAMKPNALLTGNFNLKSKLLVADDFMAFADAPATAPAKPAQAAPAGVVLVPANLNLTFTADVKEVKYNGLDITNARGRMIINKGQLQLEQFGFELVDAPIVMDATYGSITPQKAFFEYHINAQDFDVKKAYNKVKLFRDMASSAANAEGIVSLDYKLSGKLNGNMEPVYPSLKGGGVLSVKSVKLKGFRLFAAVGKETGHDSLGRAGNVSKVDIKTSIANNIITIERTKMKFAGFRPRFEGQIDFHGNMNLKFRLGLPPLGIIGIPMTITGTEAHPKVALSRGKKEDELKEEADEE